MPAAARWSFLAAGVLVVAALRYQPSEFRVCSDPNNLPFSNRQAEGFENKIANLIAADWGTSVSYSWWRQMRGFLRNTLGAGECDVVMGIPTEYDAVLSTRPYYRSSYVFIYRNDSGFEVTSLDDPILRRLRIGVNLIGDDYANTPPAHALGARGITENVRGYQAFYSDESPPGRIVAGVASGEIDVAIVWGPLGGYWAQRQTVPLKIVSLPHRDDTTGLPMAYDISMGVRRGDSEMKSRLEDVLLRKQAEIAGILREYGVPLAGDTESTSAVRDESRDGGGGATPPAAATPPTTAPPPTTAKPPTTTANPPTTATPPTAASGASASRIQAAQQAALAKPADTPMVVSADVYQGWKWWHVYCFRCHGVDAIGANLAPDLRESVTGSVTRAVFLKTTLEGRLEKGMPAWNSLLNEGQLVQIYLYLLERAEGRLPAGRPQQKEGG